MPEFVLLVGEDYGGRIVADRLLHASEDGTLATPVKSLVFAGTKDQETERLTIDNAALELESRFSVNLHIMDKSVLNGSDPEVTADDVRILYATESKKHPADAVFIMCGWPYPVLGIKQTTIAIRLGPSLPLWTDLGGDDLRGNDEGRRHANIIHKAATGGPKDTCISMCFIDTTTSKTGPTFARDIVRVSPSKDVASTLIRRSAEEATRNRNLAILEKVAERVVAWAHGPTLTAPGTWTAHITPFKIEGT